MNEINEADVYGHNGKQILHGRYTENGLYRTTRVNGVWHYHPADSEWLAFNANEDHSIGYETEAEAFADAEAEDAEDSTEND